MLAKTRICKRDIMKLKVNVSNLKKKKKLLAFSLKKMLTNILMGIFILLENSQSLGLLLDSTGLFPLVWVLLS